MVQITHLGFLDDENVFDNVIWFSQQFLTKFLWTKGFDLI